MNRLYSQTLYSPHHRISLDINFYSRLDTGCNLAAVRVGEQNSRDCETLLCTDQQICVILNEREPADWQKITEHWPFISFLLAWFS